MCESPGGKRPQSGVPTSSGVTRRGGGYDAGLMEDGKIEQAQARVATQVGCSLDRALDLMTEIARATDESIEYIADEVLAGRLTFD